MLDLLRRIPWHPLIALKFALRNRYATTSWPETAPTVVVPISHDDLETRLRLTYWEGASGFSLKYDGEKVNMRRPAGYSDEYAHDREDHLRTRDHPNGAEVAVHAEASRFAATRDHVHEVGLEWYPEDELEALLAEVGL